VLAFILIDHTQFGAVIDIYTGCNSSVSMCV
jgi:hypothetical protein